MVSEAELDRRMIVVHVVAGSSPVAYPKGPSSNGRTLVWQTKNRGSSPRGSTGRASQLAMALGLKPSERNCLGGSTPSSSAEGPIGDWLSHGQIGKDDRLILCIFGFKSRCECPKGQSNAYLCSSFFWGCSSVGRALLSHGRGSWVRAPPTPLGSGQPP